MKLPKHLVWAVSQVLVINCPLAINLYALSLEFSLIPPSVSGILRAAREVSVGLVRVGRIVSWGIWEEIFLVIFMITLPNGVFSLCTGLRFIRSKSQNYLFFLFSCLPPHFFPSFLTPSPSPSSLHLLSLFFSSFFSSSFFIPQSPAVLFNKQPPTVKACGRATVAGSWSLLESWFLCIY